MIPVGEWLFGLSPFGWRFVPALLGTLSVLMLCRIGVVYGDIGTSPLYALRECFYGSHPVARTQANVLGLFLLHI